MVCLLQTFFQLPTHGHFSRADMLYSPTGLGSMSDQKQWFESCCSRKCPQGGSTSQCPSWIPGATSGLCLVAKLCPTLCDPMDSSPPGSSLHGDSPGKNTGVSCHALLQGIFPTQGWNPGLRCYGRILYQMNHQGSPRESVFLGCGLEWNVSEETAQS